METISAGSVGTLQTKSGAFRILRDADFQKLLGLASEVHRIKDGVTFVIRAAKLVAKHKDQESLELLVQSVSMLSESSLLPERDGHDSFEITADEAEDNNDESDLTAANIRRPKL